MNTVVNQIITVNDLGANWSVTDLRTLTPLSASHATTRGDMHQEEAITPVQEKSVDEILLREEPEMREFTQPDEMTETKRKLEWSEHSFEKVKESEEQDTGKVK